MATQADLLTQVRARLDERTENNWFDAEIRTWINEGVRDVARKTECCRASTTLSMTASTQSYTGPTDAVRIHRIDIAETGSSERFNLEYRDFNTMDAVWWTQQTQTIARPELFTMWGYPPSLSLILYPTPSVAGILYVYYYKLPTAMATATTASATATIDLPAGWEDIVVDYAEIQALRMDRDPRWQESKQLYTERLEDLYVTALRFNDQAGVIVPETGGAGVPRWLWDEGWG